MQPIKVLHIAWQGLARNKLRSLLTMLGVIIGVAAVIIMLAISAGTEASIREQITSLGSNLIYVRSGLMRGFPGRGTVSSGGGLTFDDANAIRNNVDGIAGLQTLVVLDTALAAPGSPLLDAGATRLAQGG